MTKSLQSGRQSNQQGPRAPFLEQQMPRVTNEKDAKIYGTMCLNQVWEQHYYPDVNNAAIASVVRVTGRPVNSWSGADYGMWAKRLWELLPNLGKIRKGPFFLMCDLAEWWVFTHMQQTEAPRTSN